MCYRTSTTLARIFLAAQSYVLQRLNSPFRLPPSKTQAGMYSNALLCAALSIPIFSIRSTANDLFPQSALNAEYPLHQSSKKVKRRVLKTPWLRDKNRNLRVPSQCTSSGTGSSDSLCLHLYSVAARSREGRNLIHITVVLHFVRRRWLFGNREGDRRVSMGSWRQNRRSLGGLPKTWFTYPLFSYAFSVGLLLGKRRGQVEDCLASDEFSNPLYSFQSEKPFLLLLRKSLHLPAVS